MAMYPNLIHPIPPKKHKNKNYSNKIQVNSNKEQKPSIENKSDKNNREIESGKDLVKKEENKIINE